MPPRQPQPRQQQQQQQQQPAHVDPLDHLPRDVQMNAPIAPDEQPAGLDVDVDDDGYVQFNFVQGPPAEVDAVDGDHAGPPGAEGMGADDVKDIMQPVNINDYFDDIKTLDLRDQQAELMAREMGQQQQQQQHGPDEFVSDEDDDDNDDDVDDGEPVANANIRRPVALRMSMREMRRREKQAEVHRLRQARILQEQQQGNWCFACQISSTGVDGKTNPLFAELTALMAKAYNPLYPKPGLESIYEFYNKSIRNKIVGRPMWSREMIAQHIERHDPNTTTYHKCALRTYQRIQQDLEESHLKQHNTLSGRDRVEPAAVKLHIAVVREIGRIFTVINTSGGRRNGQS
jgi:hypothetical protein